MQYAVFRNAVDILHTAYSIRNTFSMPIAADTTDRTLASKQGERAYQVVEILTDAGFDAWWVGGCVREMLRGIVPTDIDIATSASPQEVMRLFPKHDDDGARFGSVIVAHRGATFEVTTFREDDAASDGRHPESVCFGERKADAQRRDFTVNAMYWHPLSRELFDPNAGEKDLSERLIRFIGDPRVRIRHDALRLLRAVRFRALIDGQYHPETYTAIAEFSHIAGQLSGERIARELEKMLLGPHPDRALEDLWETGLLSVTIPELHACRGVAQPADYHHEGDVWDHTRQVAASYTEDHAADVRWAAILHDIGKTKTFALKERIRFDGHAEVSAAMTRDILKRLQFPKARIDKIAWIIEHHMMMGAFASMSPERKAHWYFHPWFLELLQLLWLDVAGTTPSDFTLYEEIIDDYNHFLDEHPRPAKPLLRGEEIMEILGIDPGEDVGKAVQALHEAQTRKDVTTRKEAKEFLMRSKHARGRAGVSHEKS
jgi:putative nucleotidyltransferase with HDIG domain